MSSKLTREIQMAVVLAVLVAASGASGQTIALKDRGRFYVKFARTDTLHRDKIDLTRIIDWQFDSTGRVDDLRLIKELGQRKTVWMALSDDKEGIWRSSPLALSATPVSGMILSSANLAFFFLCHVDNVQSECHALSIWDLIGTDSVRYRCAFQTEYWPLNDAIKVVKVVRFPDSSFLVYLRMTSRMDGDERGNWFYRIKQLCGAQLIYRSFCYQEFKTPFEWITLDINGLDDQHYQVIEKTDYCKASLDRAPDFPVDSSKTRVINLWELTKENRQKDTTGR